MLMLFCMHWQPVFFIEKNETEEKKQMSRRRSTKVDEGIRRAAMLVNVNYSEKTVHNVRRFLGIYSGFEHSAAKLECETEHGDGAKLAPEIYEAMISEEIIPDDKIERFVMAIVEMENVKELIHNAIEFVMDFNDYGWMYFEILMGRYFGEEILSNTEIEEKIDCTHSTYFVRKEQAIMIFGIAVWSEIRKKWPNADEEVRKINDKYRRIDE